MRIIALRNLSPFSRGFSLMEMAIVLMILGTLMSGVLVAVTQTTESNRRSNTLSQLRQLEQALYGYAQTTGRLPCPATPTSNGEELASGSGCAVWYGFVPSRTLGFYGAVNEDGLLLDAWQNPVRYAVAQHIYDSNYVFSDTTTLKNFYNSGNALTNSGMLQVCDDDACNAADVISDTVPALVLSMGADWTLCSSDNEIENSCEATTTPGSYTIPNDNNFVMTQYAEDQFDDQMVWLSPYVLFSKLISAGKLP